MRKALFWLVIVMLLAGCQPVPTPTPTPCAPCATCEPTMTATATATASATPAATDTPTPAPTFDPTGFKFNARPELLMVCQGDGSHGAGGNNGYYVSGQSVSLKAMNPAPGVYNFQAPDPSGYLGQSPISAVATTTALDAKNRAAGRDPFYVWLQVMWWSPGNDWIPAHLQVERLPYIGNPADGTFPNPFDARLIAGIEPTVREMASRWNIEPRVSAMIVNLGEYGEANAKYVCAADSPSHKADCGSEPDNVLIQAAIRRVQAETGEVLTAEQMIAAYDDGSGHRWQHRWQFYLMEYFTKPMITMYAAWWPQTPLVVQLGNMSEWHFGSAHCGAEGQPGAADCWSYAEQLAHWTADHLGARAILKQNGLGNSSTYAYATLMGSLGGKTRIAWEPGGTLPSADMLRAALQTAHGSALCYQAGYYDDPMPIPLATQKAMLRGNFETYFWPLVNQ